MEGAAAATRVFEILDTPTPGLPQPGPRPTALRHARADLRSEDIRLDRVTVVYPGRPRPALEGVSLTIAPGERIVLSGPSGAGKSTLLALLLCFIAPAAGSIAVGDRDLAALDMGLAPARSMPQQPYLFSGTAADNIALGAADASRDAICRAARLAGAADFIEALPAGYDTPLGERGLRLSAGFSDSGSRWPRVFLRDPPLLLMDEPTAHLDPASARQIRDSYRSTCPGRSHRDPGQPRPGLGRGGRRSIRLDHGMLRCRQPVLPGQPTLAAREVLLVSSEPRHRARAWAS